MAALVERIAESPHNLHADEDIVTLPIAELRGVVYSTGTHSWYCVDCGNLNRIKVAQSDCGYVRCANRHCQSVWTYGLQFKRAPSGVSRNIVLERLRLLLRELARQPAE